jgi:hypothetical protein
MQVQTASIVKEKKSSLPLIQAKQLAKQEKKSKIMWDKAQGSRNPSRFQSRIFPLPSGINPLPNPFPGTYIQRHCCSGDITSSMGN